MKTQADKMAELLASYPELGVDLEAFIEEENPLLGMVGVLSILQLRLRNVLSLLPSRVSDEVNSMSGAAAAGID